MSDFIKQTFSNKETSELTENSYNINKLTWNMSG